MNDRQEAQEQTLEQLREEIIQELIKRYRNVSRYEINIDGKKYYIRNTDKNNNCYIVKLSQISLPLAHKITTYFMRLEANNER